MLMHLTVWQSDSLVKRFRKKCQYKWFFFCLEVTSEKRCLWTPTYKNKVCYIYDNGFSRLFATTTTNIQIYVSDFDISRFPHFPWLTKWVKCNRRQFSKAAHFSDQNISNKCYQQKHHGREHS